MTEERQIDYDALLHEAFRDAQRAVMRNLLTKVAEHGLPGEHHFYITFHTLAPGVSIAPRLFQKYPTDMTIVLQHRFWDLFVQADRFEVKLTFDGIRERLVIPFSSVRVFFDPSVPYGLQFDEPQERRPTPMGDMIGMGGRAGPRTAGRVAGERNERPAAERKKTARKSKNPASGEPGSADETSTGAEPPSEAALIEAAAPIPMTPAKPGPRLVDTGNDSQKVVSLDQFRKK